MSVSGLGTSHSPFPTLLPHSPAPAAVRADRSRTITEQLTEADRALIEHVTGERVAPGAEPATAFAATIAAERASGHLAPGQEVTAVYLKDLDHRYARTGRNPIAPYVDRAVAFLQATPARTRFDVSA